MVTPLPAATVILLRAPLEVLMVRRNPELAFMGGYWTFPGGKLETSDASIEAAGRREVKEEVGIDLPESVELVPFARWITPVVLPKRFDTWFYVAEADGTPEADGSEIVEARWVTPAESEDLELAFPTRKQMERIAAYQNIHDLIAEARATPVEIVLPEIVTDDGSPMISSGDGSPAIALPRLD